MYRKDGVHRCTHIQKISITRPATHGLNEAVRNASLGGCSSSAKSKAVACELPQKKKMKGAERSPKGRAISMK